MCTGCHNFPVLKISALFLLILFISSFGAQAALAGPLCQPFKIHLNYEIPYQAKSLPSADELSEDQLLVKISKIPHHQNFTEIYKEANRQGRGLGPRLIRQRWLSCLLFYVSQDTDKDGSPDWTAIVNNRPSRVLYPLDTDIDGDEVENALDHNPFEPTSKEVSLSSQEPPPHLVAHELKAREWQNKLYRDFKILAIDHTDQHSAAVLESFYEILSEMKHDKDSDLLKDLRYIYAFKGHDSRRQIAAYHHTARALSIGGVSSYPDNQLTQKQKIHVLSSLAHELGHAFLFQHMKSNELKKISERFGQWHEVTQNGEPKDLFSTLFFQPHPYLKLKNLDMKTATQVSVSDNNWTKANLASEYAMTNIHEWFADAFAAAIINKMGKKNTLGTDWRHHLIQTPHRSAQYWVNYNNLSKTFKNWLQVRVHGPKERSPAQDMAQQTSP